MKRISLGIIGVAILLLGAAGGYWKGRSAQPEKAGTQEAGGAPVPVQTAAVELRDAQQFYEFSGSVQSRLSVEVMAQVTARIRTIAVRSGMRVRKGDLLVQLDAEEIESRVKQSESNLLGARAALAGAGSDWAATKAQLASAEAKRVEAELDYRRYEKLVKDNVEPQKRLEEAESKWRSAEAMVANGRDNVAAKEAVVKAQEAVVARSEAQIDEAKTQLQYSEIRSPIDGVVVDKHAETGDLAAPGRSLLTLQSPTELWLETPVSERCAREMRTGSPVRVVLDSINAAYDTHVTEIVPVVDPKSRSFLVRAELPPKPELQPGMFGRLQFFCASQKVLSVPAGAVISRGQLQMVYVVDGDRARLRLVRSGRVAGTRIEVLTGLAEKEVVVVQPSELLRDGDRVVAETAKQP